MAIPAILFREESKDRRCEERWRVRLGAQRLDGRLAAQSLTILDLSSSGIFVETEQPLGTGSYLNVEMPGGVTRICKTIWNSGKLYGATFSEPLNDAELRDLIASSSVVWPTFSVGTQRASIEPPIHLSREDLSDFRADGDEKFPIAIRLMIIIAASAALWALIGIGIWRALA